MASKSGDGNYTAKPLHKNEHNAFQTFKNIWSHAPKIKLITSLAEYSQSHYKSEYSPKNAPQGLYFVKQSSKCKLFFRRYIRDLRSFTVMPFRLKTIHLIYIYISNSCGEISTIHRFAIPKYRLQLDPTRLTRSRNSYNHDPSKIKSVPQLLQQLEP